jgi:hypothetical protein
MISLVLEPRDRVQHGEVGIDKFMAWAIVNALKGARGKVYPPAYWDPRFTEAYNELYPRFKEIFQWEDDCGPV